ncbi:2-amino-4-deoxychorismate dehydrogenase [Sporomusa ovata DSM 2662]|uniref:Iron-sulfur flavoprotein n=1 Tax=Sporomusa ovata TaxID=2378 RepID=A0A0U1L5H5_9FIRM|nr:flavodoxin family protein [Sporomusa ovata]EQB28609.1 multimeric flavodoxin WrbA [Sporomusa ovata DSM 2662]CQR74941.1 Iron-sulfur flavoprotein [Sporomusa ovata]
MTKCKKVLGICVSGRRNGNSSIILNELLRPAKESGYQTEILNLGTLKILPCKGCFGCSSSYKCVLKDDLEMVKEKIEAADAIALASPCYYLSTPSTLKAIMDRSAAWAINIMANSKKKKYGVAVSVAGGDPFEFSLQRMFSSLFLGLYNCKIVGQFTIGHTFNKGEVLLVPSKLKLVNELGKNLIQSIKTEHCIKSNINEDESKLVCPHCLADAFHTYKDGRLICTVCGRDLKGTPDNNLASFNRFSVEGAIEHKKHIIDNVIGGMLASEEISKRLEAYWNSDVLPQEDYQIDRDLNGVIDSLKWDNDAIDVLKAVIPDTVQEIIKKTITKKALQGGETYVTKEVARRYLPKF